MRGGVVDAAHLTGRHVRLRTVVVTLGTLGYLDAAGLSVATEEGFCGGVDEVLPTYINKIIVEADGERVGDCAPCALLVTAHLVLLATDIDHHLISLRRGHPEIGPALTIHLREIVAGNGGLCYVGIVGHDEGCLHLIAQEGQHLFTIAPPQFTIARGIEVQIVRPIGAAGGRDNDGGVEGLGQFVDLLVHGDALSLTIGLYHLAG